MVLIRITALAALLALSGCVGGRVPDANAQAGIPRDARGEPLFADIAPMPVAPIVAPMPMAPPGIVPGGVVTIPLAPVPMP